MSPAADRVRVAYADRPGRAGRLSTIGRRTFLRSKRATRWPAMSGTSCLFGSDRRRALKICCAGSAKRRKCHPDHRCAVHFVRRAATRAV